MHWLVRLCYTFEERYHCAVALSEDELVNRLQKGYSYRDRSLGEVKLIEYAKLSPQDHAVLTYKNPPKGSDRSQKVEAWKRPKKWLKVEKFTE